MGSVRIMVSYDGEWVKSPETGLFRFDGSKAKGMLVSKNITYGALLERVYALLDINRDEFEVSMKFLYASSAPVAPAEIVNDDDASFFVCENSGKASLRTPLCVSLERKDTQIAGEEASSQTFNDASPAAEAREDQDIDDVGADNDPILVKPVAAVPAAMKWVTTKEALTASLTTSSSVSQHSEEELEVRQLFSSKKELQEKLSIMAIRKNFEFRVQKSSPDVLVVACIDEKCPWRLRACKFRDNTSFQVRKFFSEHTCSTESRCSEHRQASSWVISQIIKSKCTSGTESQSYKPKDIIEDVRKELGVSLSYEKAWRAREIALSSEGVLHKRQRLLGWSSGTATPKREKSSQSLNVGVNKDDRRIRRCKKCGEVGHYSKTCSAHFTTRGPIVRAEKERVVEQDKVIETEKRKDEP